MKTKQCTKCKEIKLLSEFLKDKNRKDGFGYTCKKCRKEYFREYTQTDKGKEALKKSRKKYEQTEKGKESRKKRVKKYQQTDKGKEALKKSRKKYRLSDKGKESNRKRGVKYREKNLERVKKYAKQWREKNREYVKKYLEKNFERNKEQRKKRADNLKVSYPEKLEDKKYCQKCNRELNKYQIICNSLYCSHKCRGISTRRPETQVLRRRFRGYDWGFKTKRTRERDYYTCQICSLTEKETSRTHGVHHIKPWHEFKDKSEANDNYNLITLCNNCHLKHENDESYRIIFLETTFLNELLFQGKNKKIEIIVGEEK